MATLPELLHQLVEMNGSDLHLTTATPPQVRVHGKLQRLEGADLGPADTKQLAYSVLSDVQKKRFEESFELDFSFGLKGLARFRCNMFNQRGAVGAVYRLIPELIRGFQELALPTVLATLADRPRGLVLVTGPTGSGKSTTLAAMIDYCNRNRRDHILTIEDPIEFVHESKNCLVNHREVGMHSQSFAAALKGALREDPDIILIGEMRDLETIELALTAANTGHLVFGTLHTPSAAKTVDRIIDVFPAEQQNKIRATLAEALRGVVSQNLFKRIDRRGRVAALEILVFTSAISNLVREGKTHQIPGMIQVGKRLGNQPLDDAILEHVRMKRITPEEAYDKCIDKKKFRPFLTTPPDDEDGL